MDETGRISLKLYKIVIKEGNAGQEKKRLVYVKRWGGRLQSGLRMREREMPSDSSGIFARFFFQEKKKQ